MKTLHIWILFLFTCSISCYAQNNKRLDIPLDSSEIFPSLTNGDSVIEKNDNNDTFLRSMYSFYLTAINEPLVLNDSGKNEIYRFIWVRTFHNPIVIRIERQNEIYKLSWKVNSGMGGYDLGKLITDSQINITKAKWDEFKDSLSKIDFWKMKPTIDDLGLDGAQWVLEGKLPNQYHIVDRWSPEQESKFYQCCYYLIKLTNLKFKAEDIY